MKFSLPVCAAEIRDFETNFHTVGPRGSLSENFKRDSSGYIKAAKNPGECLKNWDRPLISATVSAIVTSNLAHNLGREVGCQNNF